VKAARRILSSTLLSLSITACLAITPTHGGTPIDPAWVQSLERGKTTMEEVRTKMGAPSSITRSPDIETWTYTHWEGKPAIVGEGYRSMSTQSLIVRFKAGKVSDYSLSSSAGT
jgi:outer membrane protein assembly factor BamE (lipoprotein component of BamABCDE complex)